MQDREARRRVENESSGNSASTASATMTSTLVPSNRSRRGSPRDGSISTAVILFTRRRSKSVVRPGPGPISSTWSPRSPAASTQGMSSSSSIWAHWALARNWRWVSFTSLTCTISRWWPSLHNRSKICHCRPSPASWTCGSGAALRPEAYLYEGHELVTTWHSHDLHQIEYAFHGAVEVETAVSHCLLPPQQAAWIPAGVEHRTTIRTSVRTISVFFSPHLVPAPGDRVRILPVPPVLREMMIYSGRWPIGRADLRRHRRRLLRRLGSARLRTPR